MAKRKLSQGNITQLEQQMKIYDLKIAENSNDNESYYLKALNLIKLARKEEALYCLEKAILINPNELAYYAYQAQLYFELEEYGQAKKVFREIEVRQLPNINNTRNNKAKDIVTKLYDEIKKIANDSTKKEEKQNLEHRIEVLEEEKQELQGRLENLEEKNQELEHRLENLEQDNQKIKKDVSLSNNILENYVVKRTISSVEYKFSHSLTHQESAEDLLGDNA